MSTLISKKSERNMHLFTHVKEERNRENVKKIVNQNSKYMVVSYINLTWIKNDVMKYSTVYIPLEVPGGSPKKTRWGLGSISLSCFLFSITVLPMVGISILSSAVSALATSITNNCPKKQWKLCNLTLSIVLWGWVQLYE